MRTYRCYFLDQDEHICEPSEPIEAELLSDAIQKALDNLAARARYYSVELWDGGRRVYPEVRPRLL